MAHIPTLLIGISILALTALPSGVFANGSDYRPSSVGAKLEVVMTGSGKATVSGARVREVTESGFRAETLWGAGKLTWNVRTDENTPITRKNGTRITLTQVTPGDYVSFTGEIQTSMAPFTVVASQVRDWSIGPNHTVIEGTVEEIDSGDRSFTAVSAEGDTVVIRTNEDTTYAQSGARTFADISEGDTIMAFGEKGKEIVATKINLVGRADISAETRPYLATGFGSWVDYFLPKFFQGRMN